MKRFAKWLVVIMTVCCVALSLAACDSCGSEHEHTFATEWSTSDTEHWHAATCEHKDEVKDKAEHTFANGKCSVCGKEQPSEHEHTFDTDTWKSDSTYHWHASTCGHTDVTDGKAEHTYVGGECSTCHRKENEEHEHTYSDSWSTSETHHWYAPTCQDTTENKSYGEHDWNTVELKVATCELDGETKHTCKVCGYTKSETVKASHNVPAANHHAAVEATCESAGNIEYWECEDCHKLFSDSKYTQVVTNVTVPKGAHEYETVAARTTAASCTTYGVTVEKCKHCDDERVTQHEPLGHKWNHAKSCTEGRECTVEGCDASESPLGHSYALAASVEANCTHDGEETYVCETCRDTYKETTATATGHSVAAWELRPYNEVVPATYADGDTEHKLVFVGQCDNENCPDKNDDGLVIELDENGSIVTVCAHEYTMTSMTAATCMQEGVKTYTCSYCDETKTENYDDENAHKWGNAAVAENITTYTCEHNPEHKKTAISKKTEESAAITATDLGGNEIELQNAAFKFDDTAAANIAADKENLTIGAEILEVYGEYKNVYNLTLTEGETPVTSFGGGTVTVSVPYELGENEDPKDIAILYINETGEVEQIKARFVNGYAVFETTHFSYYTVTRLTPAERCALYGHSEYVEIKEATCITDGYTLTTCLRCGEVKKENIVPAKGHDFETETVDATCTTAGSEHSECKNCGFELSRKLPATGHNLVTKIELGLKVSCAQAGVTVQECVNCSKRFTTLIAQLQHDYETVVTPATCTRGGYTTKTCKNNECGHFRVVTDFTPATGHSYAVTDYKAATCDADGYTVYSCSGCTESYREVAKRTGHVWDIAQPTCGRGQVCTICAASGLAATGKHTMTDGVCSVCGAGCDHKYTPEVVAPTCTERGYTLKTCTECGKSEMTDFKPALGHKGTLECERCGETIVTSDFYVNMLQSILGSDYTVKLGSFEMVLDNIYFQKINVNEFYLGLDEDGELCAYGYGDIVDGNSSSAYQNYYMGVKIIVEKGMAYVIGDQSGMFYGSFEGYSVTYTDDMTTMYMAVPVEKLDEMMFGGSSGYMSMIPDAYKWLRNDLVTIVDAMVTVNKTGLSGVLKALLDRLYTVESVAGGYSVTLDADGLEEFIEVFETKKMSEALDEIFGEGTYDNIMSEASDLLGTKGSELAGKLAIRGVDINELLDAVANLGSIIVGQSVTASEFLSGMLGMEISIEDILKSDKLIYKEIAAIMGDADTEVTKEELLEMFESLLNYELYYNISAMVGIDEDTIAEFVDVYLPILKDMTVTMNVDANGYLKSAALSIDSEYFDTLMGVNSVVGDMTVLIGNTTVYDYESLKSGITGVTDLVNLDNIHFGAYWANIGAETEYYGDDGEGSIRMARYTETREYMRNLDEIYHMGRYEYEYALALAQLQDEVKAAGHSNFTVLFMERQENDIELEFSDDPAIMLRADCGNWYYADVNAHRTSDYTYGIYVLKAIGPDGRVLTDNNGESFERIIEEGRKYDGGSYSSTGLEFFIHAKTGEIRYVERNNDGSYSEPTLHSYVEDETKFVEAEGCTGAGTIVYNCTECGKILTQHFAYGHGRTKGEIVREAEGETVNEQTCNDGIKVERVCLDCGEVIYTYTSSRHERWTKAVYDLTEYGASESCGGRMILYGCLCGKSEADTHIEYSNENRHDFGGRQIYDRGWNDCFYVYTCAVTDPQCNFRYSEKTYTKGCEVRRTIILACDANGAKTDKSVEIDFYYRDVHDWSIELSRTPNPDRECEYYTVDQCSKCGATRENRIHDPSDDQLYTEEKQIGECYYEVMYICKICGSHVRSEEEYHHVPSGHGSVEPTCTQFGMDDVCDVCGVAINLVNPTDHKWQKNEEKSVCSVCGLENTNGASGRIWLEDVSDRLGKGDDYVVGYYDLYNMRYEDRYYNGRYDIEFHNMLRAYRYENEFTAVVSIVFERAGEQEGQTITDTRMLNVAVNNYTHDERLGAYEHYVRFSKSEAVNAAQNFIAENPTLNITEYSIRLTFVPRDNNTNLDYAVTFDPITVGD